MTKKINTNHTPDKKLAYLSQVITFDNVQALGEHTASKALKTIHRKSQDKYIYILIKDLQTDLHKAKRDIEYTYSNAFDIVQLATCFYLQYVGQPLNATANNGELDKDGNPIDILRACYRTVNRYIMAHKNKVYKTLYLQDIDENGKLGEYIAIPHLWDIGTKANGEQTHTIQDLNDIKNLFDNLNLSVTENKVLSARLRGFGYDIIAKKLGISKGTVQTYIKRIQAKAIAINLTPQAIRQARATA